MAFPKLSIFILVFSQLYGLISAACRHKSRELDTFLRKSIFASTFGFILLTILLMLLFLVFLGLIKGIIGLTCSKTIGVMGLGRLIDLPRPLKRYQESSICDRQVVYDVGGWPIHPDSGERNVRVLTMQTEFCLNLVFFMSYPLALMISVCAFCCCVRNHTADDEEHTCFKSFNIIKRIEHCGSKRRRDLCDCGKGKDMYKDDKKEKADTTYIMHSMRESRESLKAHHYYF